jgi:hypothetical protein
MAVKIDTYEGIGLFARNDNSHARVEPRPRRIDPRVPFSIDVSLFCCLRKLGASRDRICSALLISYEEYEDLIAMK